MTNSDLIDDDISPSEIDFAREASRLLRAWIPLVRKLPELVNKDDRKRVVPALVLWYTHAAEEEEYSADTPVEGLDALIDELAEAVVPIDAHAELAQARWAIRVAEELVRWRRCLRRSGEGSREMADVTDRLELAIDGARRQMAAM